jgi:hypothetical protein
LDSAERATAPKPAASGEISAAETIHLVRSAGLDARFGTNDDLEVTWYPAERRARPELNAGDICHGSLPYAYPVVSPASCPAALDAEHTNTLTTVDGVATWAIKAAPGAWLEVWGATLDGDPIYWLGPVPSVSPAP